MTDDIWMTTKQAAAYTGYSPESLARFARNGDVKARRRSGNHCGWRFRKADLDDFILGDDEPEEVIPEPVADAMELDPELARHLASKAR